MYSLSLNNRERLKNSAIIGAGNYSKYLINKDFLVVCEDGTSAIIHFFKGDFMHLTGIKSNVDEMAFFNLAEEGKLDIGNIQISQQHNWKTLVSKAKRIEHIQDLIYEKTEDSLFMVNLHTEKADFPVAIRNIHFNGCVGFKDKANKARTLRKYANSGTADEEKKIVAIFAKRTNAVLYDEQVFLGNKTLVQNDDLLFSSLSEELKKNFAILEKEPTAADEAAATKIE